MLVRLQNGLFEFFFPTLEIRSTVFFLSFFFFGPLFPLFSSLLTSGLLPPALFLEQSFVVVVVCFCRIGARDKGLLSILASFV